MSYVTVHGTPIYYSVTGQADGPTVVFSHGGGGNAASWFNQLAHFEPTHRRVVFDHRGFGRSPSDETQANPTQYASDLAAILDAAEVDEAHVTSIPRTIAAGSSEIQRNIIATRGLRLPRG